MIFVNTNSYEAPKAQIVRRFQNLGVQRANPNEYVARYGTQLEDAQSLLTHARQAGVVEDIVNLFQLIEKLMCNRILVCYLVASCWYRIKLSIFKLPKL